MRFCLSLVRSSASSSFYYNFHDPKDEDKSNENESTEEPKENDADELQENAKEDERPIDVENVGVPEHCNRKNDENEEASKTEDETQVKDVE